MESNEAELVLVPTDGSEPLWLTRTGAADQAQTVELAD